MIFTNVALANPAIKTTKDYTLFLETNLSNRNGLPMDKETRGSNLGIGISGKFEYKVLDFSFDLYRSNVFSGYAPRKNFFYAKINPRLSIDRVFGVDLSFWIFKEMFFAYQVELNNASNDKVGFTYDYVGFGWNLNIPKFDYFKLNLYARFIEKDEGVEFNSWNGFMIDINYGIPIYMFKKDLGFYYSGFLDYALTTNKHIYVSKGINGGDFLRWKNEIRFEIYKGISLSVDYQLNYFMNYTTVKNKTVNLYGVSFNYRYNF